MESYLRETCQTVQNIEFLDGLDTTCQLEFDGSTLYKTIHILVSCIGSIILAQFIYFSARLAMSWTKLEVI